MVGEGSGTTSGRDETDSRMGDAMELISNPAFVRGHALRAGVKLGLFDTLADGPRPADAVAHELRLDAENTYRLLRGLAQHGVVDETEDRAFSLTPTGEHFRTDHPRSVCDAVLLMWHPDRLRAFTHLPDIVREGGPAGYEREFGCSFWAHKEQNPELARAFDGTMTALSRLEAPWILETLDGYDVDQFSRICDVGGGRGYLLCRLLDAHDHLEGTVLELPEVVEEDGSHWAPELGVADRCAYVAGDMFETVPEADAYLLKDVLHDWSDEECVEILSTIAEDAPSDARLFVVEQLRPPPGETGPEITFDVHMMTVTAGHQRTEAEFRALFDRADWTLVETWTHDEGRYSVVEATPDRR